MVLWEAWCKGEGMVLWEAGCKGEGVVLWEAGCKGEGVVQGRGVAMTLYVRVQRAPIAEFEHPREKWVALRRTTAMSLVGGCDHTQPLLLE